ncbi:protein PHLOEM PROTEIN 2-LIKE A1-like isoform X2 [Mangifera indica]|uniref:protein PHLOEM PROTEIN 2-LIKE A1-like isoform X1 n=1 Tax=Mangifera indica TaxID=29780 RepID=UPI001CFB7500|nr:protein PHLOEM PROTEIN 2-LIKE A1-like isoform X1 [Mangifera indica]XP_044497097.1 protein PHLOEM PROTEIN 2-LIKE A1-like isoform X2 [Mangifera indica]
MASAQVQLPHNLHAILKEGDSQIDASCDNLIENLQAGIFLNQNKLKFWVDRLLWANAFDIHAKGLIIYGDMIQVAGNGTQLGLYYCASIGLT